MIPSYSAEARGRSERMFRTLQDRLPKEMTMAGISDMDAAKPLGYPHRGAVGPESHRRGAVGQFEVATRNPAAIGQGHGSAPPRTAAVGILNHHTGAATTLVAGVSWATAAA